MMGQSVCKNSAAISKSCVSRRRCKEFWVRRDSSNLDCVFASGSETPKISSLSVTALRSDSVSVSSGLASASSNRSALPPGRIKMSLSGPDLSFKTCNEQIDHLGIYNCMKWQSVEPRASASDKYCCVMQKAANKVCNGHLVHSSGQPFRLI